MFIKIIFLLFSLPGFSSENIEQIKSIEQLNLWAKKKENLLVLSKACEIQIKSKMIPQACYHLLKQDEKKYKRESIDSKCQQAVEIQSSLESLEKFAFGVSKACADFIEEKKKIIRYQQEDLKSDFL